jgi:photosystem II stability/assembly factor-like uncharacterized protein
MNNGYIVGAYTILKTTNGGGNWIQQTIPPDVDGQLISVSFPDPNTGWAVGHYGTIIKTTNGGDTWTSQSSSNVSLTSIHCYDQNISWAAGGSG